MVALPKAVDVEKQAGQGGNSVLIPQGQYQAIICASELKETKGGAGKMIVFTINITHGEYAHTEFKEYVNIVNSNAKTVEIAYQTIANIGKAVKLAVVNDSSELHNKPLMIEIKTKPAKDWADNDGKMVAGKERSEIKKFLPLPAGGAPAAQQQVETAAEATPAASTAEAPQSNPFAPK